MGGFGSMFGGRGIGGFGSIEDAFASGGSGTSVSYSSSYSSSGGVSQGKSVSTRTTFDKDGVSALHGAAVPVLLVCVHISPLDRLSRTHLLFSQCDCRRNARSVKRPPSGQTASVTPRQRSSPVIAAAGASAMGAPEIMLGGDSSRRRTTAQEGTACKLKHMHVCMSSSNSNDTHTHTHIHTQNESEFARIVAF